MATLVFFHAHPDDEALATGGTIARYAREGHRVVIVWATGGEHGEIPDGMLASGETTAELRRREAEGSANALGAARIAWLGFTDSGMMGTPENDAPESFWQTDVDIAAARLAAILDEERADVLTCYDEHGNYGHPDHIQVHRVGHRAAAKAGTPKVYEATINRDHLKALITMGRDMFGDVDGMPSPEELDALGMPAEVITTTIDVMDDMASKRASFDAHKSQINDTGFFLSLPEDAFNAAFGQEWFILAGAPAGTVEDDLLTGLH